MVREACTVLIAAFAVHAPADPLRFTVDAPGTARLGELVPITLRLTNPTDRPIEAYFLGRTIAFDIVITRQDGTPVWRRLEGAMVPGILQVRTIGPGEVLVWAEVWHPPERGRFRIQGVLPSDAREPRRTLQAVLLVS